jgi:hypothetical protein
MASATLDDVLHVRGVGEAIVAHLPCDALCCVAAVSRHCNELACAPSLYARLSFDNLTPRSDGLPRMVSNMVLATLCRRAGASLLRFVDIRAFECVCITPDGLDAALQALGVDRSMVQVRMLRDWAPKGGVRWDERAQRWCTRVWNPATETLAAFMFFDSEAAARCYDDAVRAAGGTVVNFPAHAGETQVAHHA